MRDEESGRGFQSTRSAKTSILCYELISMVAEFPIHEGRKDLDRNLGAGPEAYCISIHEVAKDLDRRKS